MAKIGIAALIIVAGFGLWWGFLGGESLGGQHPSVLLISLDTVRADYVGFLGKRLPDGSSPTPHLDALAARSAPMKKGWTPAPLTLPAHASVMTGLDPDRHGLRENDSFQMPKPDARDFSLLAEDLRAADYQTAAFVSGQPLESSFGLNQGFLVYEQPRADEDRLDRLRFRERSAESTTRDAMDWLKQREDAPWFLFVHYFDAHDPYEAPSLHPSLDSGNRKHQYLAEIMRIDRAVGKLLEAIKEQDEEVLIIVFADHGEGLGDNNEKTHGYLLHRATLQVPFLLKPPEGMDASAHATVPARLTDIYPTVLAATGVTSAKPLERDGRSLFEPADPSQWHWFAETLYPYYQFQYAHRRCCGSVKHAVVSGGLNSDGTLASDAFDAEDPQAGDLSKEDVQRLEEALAFYLSRPGKGRALDIVTDPSPFALYMGGRPTALPLEPDTATNRTLPLAKDRWDTIEALDEARAAIRRGEPHLASQVLSKYESELKTNPALLYWTARALQLQGRMQTLEKDTRQKRLSQADALYARHEEQFKDSRTFDARLRVLLDRHAVSGATQPLKQLVRQAGQEIDRNGGRSLTLIFRGMAHEKLGDTGLALKDFRRAQEMDPHDPRIGRDVERLQQALNR